QSNHVSTGPGRSEVGPCAEEIVGQLVMCRLVNLIVFICALIQTTSGDDAAYVRVNQLGYRPGDVKSAVAMGHAALPARFQVVDVKSQKVVLDGESRVIEQTWGQFKLHTELDFSGLIREGEYFIKFGDAKSHKF